MQTQAFDLRAWALVVGLALLAFSGWAVADPPSRVARLGHISGDVSFSPAGQADWDQATLNRPLTTGDRLWTDGGARAEIQVGGAVIRLGAATGVSVLNLDDRIAQWQLTQGTLIVRVRRLASGQVFEVDTPNLAFTLRKPGEYRIQVDPDEETTTIVVRKGEGEVYGEGASYMIDRHQAYRFSGTDLSEYEYVDAPRPDELDRWASDRDRRYDSSRSARYVSSDVVGYQDLDANGDWRDDETYGKVWIPSRVDADWAPYRDGHWAWVDPWGWTWIDDAPWGFAVSHYGRWANLRGSWAWVPGPVSRRAYYAPALVVFVGGDNFQISISSGDVGGVAWFPLAPREVYRPSYRVSRRYYEDINRSNTVINNTVIINTYNTYNTTSADNTAYANRRVRGAIVAVPTSAFVQSQPVSRSHRRISRELIASRPVAVAPAVAPTERSVRGTAARGDKPSARVFERPVVARNAPPAAHAGFAAQQQRLKDRPGKPLDSEARKELAAPAPAAVVKVLAQTPQAPPTERPPAADARRSRDSRRHGEQRLPPSAPVAAPPAAAAKTDDAPPATPPTAAPPAPNRRTAPEARDKENARDRATPPRAADDASPQRREPRDRSEQRGNSEQRKPAAEPPAAPPPRADESVRVPPQATPADPPAQRREPRDRSEQRGNSEQRKSAAEPPAVPPPRAAEPRSVPPQATPADPSAQRRERAEQRRTAAEAREVQRQPAQAAPARAAPSRPEALPGAGTDEREPRPGASQSRDKKKSEEERRREEERKREEEGKRNRP